MNDKIDYAEVDLPPDWKHSELQSQRLPVDALYVHRGDYQFIGVEHAETADGDKFRIERVVQCVLENEPEPETVIRESWSDAKGTIKAMAEQGNLPAP
jgi:hypothetical protein